MIFGPVKIFLKIMSDANVIFTEVEHIHAKDENEGRAAKRFIVRAHGSMERAHAFKRHILARNVTKTKTPSCIEACVRRSFTLTWRPFARCCLSRKEDTQATLSGSAHARHKRKCSTSRRAIRSIERDVLYVIAKEAVMKAGRLPTVTRASKRTRFSGACR